MIEFPIQTDYSVHYFFEQLFGKQPPNLTEFRVLPQSYFPDESLKGVYSCDKDIIILSDSLEPFAIVHEVAHRFMEYEGHAENPFLEEGVAEYLRFLYGAYDFFSSKSSIDAPFENINTLVRFTDILVNSYNNIAPRSLEIIYQRKGLLAVNREVASRKYESSRDLGDFLKSLMVADVAYQLVE